MPPNLGPRYRPPFKPGYDPRRFDSKAYAASKPPTPKVKRYSSKLVASIRKAFYRHCEAATNEAIDPDKAMRHARVAKLFFDLHQSLYDPKRGNKPHLQQSGQTKPISPISPILSEKVEKLASSLPPDASLASGMVDSTVKPVATPLKSIQSTPIESQSEDDCPF